MARFRKARRRIVRYFAKRRSSRSSASLSIEKLAIGSAAYGAVRPYAANMIPDIEMLGTYSDNVILGVAGYIAAKKGNGMIKTAGQVILANEAFLVGNKLASGLAPSGSNTGYVYG